MALWKGTWLEQEGEDKHGMNDNNSEDDSDGIRKRVLSRSKSDVSQVQKNVDLTNILDPRCLDLTNNQVQSSVDLTVGLTHLLNPRYLDLTNNQVQGAWTWLSAKYRATWIW
ncbi:hypothetical protein NC651_005005 [Populus alba x Populus x berolinensis]|nr:hypothetical protein NC651_005005 [Populus alba x Populus x berolinensis]